MIFTFDAPFTAQQKRWTDDAISQCTYKLDSIPANVHVAWVRTMPGNADTTHPYMVTVPQPNGDCLISVAKWADDPSNPGNQGLPSPTGDIEDFYKQSFVHELGHVVIDNTFNPGGLDTDPRVATCCALFTHADPSSGGRRSGTIKDWDADPLAWADEIREGVAEFFKRAFYTGRLIFQNRTNWDIDTAKWAAMGGLLKGYPLSLTGLDNGLSATTWEAPLGGDVVQTFTNGVPFYLLGDGTSNSSSDVEINCDATGITHDAAIYDDNTTPPSYVDGQGHMVFDPGVTPYAIAGCGANFSFAAANVVNVREPWLHSVRIEWDYTYIPGVWESDPSFFFDGNRAQWQPNDGSIPWVRGDSVLANFILYVMNDTVTVANAFNLTYEPGLIVLMQGATSAFGYAGGGLYIGGVFETGVFRVEVVDGVLTYKQIGPTKAIPDPTVLLYIPATTYWQALRVVGGHLFGELWLTDPWKKGGAPHMSIDVGTPTVPSSFGVQLGNADETFGGAPVIVSEWKMGGAPAPSGLSIGAPDRGAIVQASSPAGRLPIGEHTVKPTAEIAAEAIAAQKANPKYKLTPFQQQAVLWQRRLDGIAKIRVHQDPTDPEQKAIKALSQSSTPPGGHAEAGLRGSLYHQDRS